MCKSLHYLEGYNWDYLSWLVLINFFLVYLQTVDANRSVKVGETKRDQPGVFVVDDDERKLKIKGAFSFLP